jgi:heme/copper-type cytochrome/quinol oxidase subunit 3
VDEVPRSFEVQTGAGVAAVSRTRRSLPNGIWAMALFVATEAALFGAFIGTYWYLANRAPEWPPNGIAPPKAVLPLVLTGVLVLTMIPIVLAALAARRGRRGTAWGLVALALPVQAGYLAWQILLYRDDLDRFSPDHSAYGSIYYLMVGADHAHVGLGVLLDLWVLIRLARGLNHYRAVTVQATAIYWVVVAAITIAVTLTQVSPS